MPTTGPESGARPQPQPTLACDRLVLRPLTRADIPALVPLADDAEVATRTASIPYPFTRQDAEAWMEKLRRSGDRAKQIVFALERREDNAFLGALGFEVAGVGEPAVIGFWLGRAYWGRGYMAEAIRRLLAYAFEEVGVIAVRAAAFPDNLRSIRLQERLGMRRVGHEIRPAPARGGDRLVVVYELSRESWRA